MKQDRIYFMTRREAREAAIALLFERACRSGETAEEVYNRSLYLRGAKENEYIRDAYFGVWDNAERIDGAISGAAHEWSLERMSKVTLSILRLASYELYYLRGVPKGVTINEAIELAKKYDEESAPAFINGILSKIASDPSIEKDVVPRGPKK